VAALRLDRGPVLGGLAGGLVTAVCCGGLPLFAGIGLGAFFAGPADLAVPADAGGGRHAGDR